MSYITQLSQFDNWPVVRKPKYNVGDRVVIKFEKQEVFLGVILAIEHLSLYKENVDFVYYTIGTKWNAKDEEWAISTGWMDKNIISVVERAS